MAVLMAKNLAYTEVDSSGNLEDKAGDLDVFPVQLFKLTDIISGTLTMPDNDSHNKIILDVNGEAVEGDGSNAITYNSTADFEVIGSGIITAGTVDDNGDAEAPTSVGNIPYTNGTNTEANPIAYYTIPSSQWSWGSATTSSNSSRISEKDAANGLQVFLGNENGGSSNTTGTYTVPKDGTVYFLVQASGGCGDGAGQYAGANAGHAGGWVLGQITDAEEDMEITVTVGRASTSSNNANGHDSVISWTSPTSSNAVSITAKAGRGGDVGFALANVKSNTGSGNGVTITEEKSNNETRPACGSPWSGFPGGCSRFGNRAFGGRGYHSWINRNKSYEGYGGGGGQTGDYLNAGSGPDWNFGEGGWGDGGSSNGGSQSGAPGIVWFYQAASATNSDGNPLAFSETAFGGTGLTVNSTTGVVTAGLTTTNFTGKYSRKA